jgi:hypothetical protein
VIGLKLLYKFGLVRDIYSDVYGDVYLRHIYLTPRFKFGQLRIHYFFRGDTDVDPHDHRWDFWTFPLCRSGYLESVPDHNGIMRANKVPGFKVSHRPAEYAHLVLGMCEERNGLHEVTPGAFATLMWIGPTRREWGFWPFASEAVRLGMLDRPVGTSRRVFVPWRTYIAKRAPPVPMEVDKRA